MELDNADCFEEERVTVDEDADLASDVCEVSVSDVVETALRPGSRRRGSRGRIGVSGVGAGVGNQRFTVGGNRWAPVGLQVADVSWTRWELCEGRVGG